MNYSFHSNYQLKMNNDCNPDNDKQLAFSFLFIVREGWYRETPLQNCPEKKYVNYFLPYFCQSKLPYNIYKFSLQKFSKINMNDSYF